VPEQFLKRHDVLVAACTTRVDITLQHKLAQ